MNETLTFADLQDTGNAQAHLVLLAVARCANWETGECWPGVKTVAKMAKCSERTARSYLAKLEADGFIETVPQTRENGATSVSLLRLVGYADWIAALRTGKKSPKPKAVGKYVDIPPADLAPALSDLQGAPASTAAGGPCKQVAGAYEPSLEHKSNSCAGTRQANDFDLEVKKAAAQPELRLTPSDGGKWSAWLAILTPEQFNQAEASGELFVTAYWPDSKGARLVRIGKSSGLSERSRSMMGSDT